MKMTATPAEFVAICVATCRRPNGLERLLGALEQLVFDPGSEPSAIRLIVVDNDPARSAEPVHQRRASSSRWPMVYVSEPRPGIPFARNACVRAARVEGAELLAFIDDDEVPDPRWLAQLLMVLQEHDAAVATGPVLPLFEQEPPSWVQRGGFFDRLRYPTGQRMTRAYTGNVLLRLSVFDGLESPFDENRPFTGGTDTQTFLRVASAGHRIIWADDAVVHEWNPPSRSTARWLIQRAYRVSSNWSTCERELHPSPAVKAARVGKALARMAQGMLLLPLAIVGGRHRLVRSAQYLSMGAGFIAGVFGREFDEYRTTHGS